MSALGALDMAFWDLRGQGLGLALFERALERAGDRVVGLDGVLEIGMS